LDLLAKVTRLPNDELDQSLAALEQSGLLFRHGLGQRLSFSFKHALLQEAAYEGLLKSRRRQIHARIAKVLKEDFPDALESQPELLAHHLTEAGLLERAIDVWCTAGKRADQRSDLLEAVTNLKRGLFLLERLPESDDRDRKELELESALSGALIGVKGWGNPDTVSAFDRVRVLAERLGDQDKILYALAGRVLYHYAGTAEMSVAHRYAEEFLQLAESIADTSRIMSGRRFLGYTLFAQGKLRRSCKLIESAVEQYEPSDRTLTSVQVGQNPWVSVKSRPLAHGKWMLGYPDQARESATAAINYARKLQHGQTLTFALQNGGIFLGHLRRDYDSVRAHADELARVARRQRIVLWELIADFNRELVDALQGVNDITPHSLRKRAEAFSTIRADSVFTLECFAQVCLVREDASEGFQYIEEAKHELNRTGMRNLEADLCRIEGDLHLLRGETHAALRCFEKSLQVARAQEAKSWELRTALDLAQVWRSQGKADQARALLKPIFDWFTEGFDSVDLISARILLGTLEK
jgi:tetratricopeptide (TPR) repeat protein